MALIHRGGRFGQTDIDGSEIGIRLNIPLYAGGSVVSKTRQATQQHAAALERLEKARRAVYRDTHEAFLGILTQISAVHALMRSIGVGHSGDWICLERPILSRQPASRQSRIQEPR